jgi:hypothetical protein
MKGAIEVLGSPQITAALSDHGVQMAKKIARRCFQIRLLLKARRKAPADNGGIDSWFCPLKYSMLHSSTQLPIHKYTIPCLFNPVLIFLTLDSVISYNT